MSSHYLPYARLLLRGALCFGLAIAGWEAGRWWRHRQPEPPPREGARPAEKKTPEALVETKSPALQKWLHGSEQPQGVMRRLARLRAKDISAMPDEDMIDLLNDRLVSDADKHSLVSGWGERNPAALWEWLKSQEPGRRDINALGLFRSWFKSDPKAALHAVLTAPPWLVTNAESGLIWAWSLGDVEASDEVLSYLDKIIRKDPFIGHLQNLGSNDHSGQAGERIMTLPEGELRSIMARHYALGRFRMDWEKGMGWIKPLPQQEQNVILEQWAGATFDEARSRARNGPPDDAFKAKLARAGQWLAETPDDSAKARLGVKYAGQLSATDPKAALEWARQWLDAAPLAAAVQQVIEVGFEKNRAEISEILESLPPGGVRMKATDQMAGKWMEKAPAEAAAWALTLDKEAMTYQGWAGLGYQWAAKDAAMFKQRIMEAGPEQRSLLLTGAVNQMMNAAPVDALDWLRTLPEAGRGERIIDNALSSWSHSDPRAAAQYAAKHPGEYRDTRAYPKTGMVGAVFYECFNLQRINLM